MSIQKLRRIAELNLCENCYEKYKAILEPSIKQWLFKPLSNWREVESNITQMVMKFKCVFKTNVIFISLDGDSNEKYADEVDVKTFEEIKRWGFKKKLRYLKDNEILQDSSYNFLYRMSEIRNRIHDPFKEFSEQDFALFSWAGAITHQIHSATMFNWEENTSSNMKANAEKVAEQMLLKINERVKYNLYSHNTDPERCFGVEHT